MKNLKSLNKHLFRYRYRLMLGIIFIAFANVFGVYSPQVVRNAVDSVTTRINYYQFYTGSVLAQSI
jgi:ATP-binding cassette subfamily B protein